MSKPSLSVVIPTQGRPILLRTIESLFASKGADHIEVIVAGRIHYPAIKEQLEDRIACDSRLHHLDVEYEVGDSSEKKNAGFRHAQSDLIAFLDDDVRVAPDWPEQMILAFEREDVDILSGPSLVPPDVSYTARLAGLSLSSKAAGYVSNRYRQAKSNLRKIRWSEIIGCNMVYRRAAFDRVGGFDPKFWPGEEMIASWRASEAGLNLSFLSDAWVYHYPRHSLKRFWKQIHGYGATRIRLIRAGTELEPATLVPMVFVLALLSLLLFLPIFPVAKLGLFGVLGAYALVDFGITLQTVVSSQQIRDAGVFFVIPLMHVSYGIAGWIELLRPNKDLSHTQEN